MDCKKDLSLFSFVEADSDFKEAFEGKKITNVSMCTESTYQFSHMDKWRFNFLS